MKAAKKPNRQELHCPHCQLYLVCSIGDGMGEHEERAPEGWSDAPAHAHFYELFVDPPEIRKAILLDSLWCVDSQTSCPGCQQSFTPRDAGVTERPEDAKRPQEISWKKA
ncbi:MAG: hypothetical protein P1V97_12445, partial [Planctomycetota bacterium]|nr:hypothetical protein [Planctomycetota bacterium]